MSDFKDTIIFHSYHSLYYKIIAEVLAEILQGHINKANLNEKIYEWGLQDDGNKPNRVNTSIFNGFDSNLWHLVKVDPVTKQYSTILQHKPTIPPSNMEKRWLKTILNDPRARLFDLDWEGLDKLLADVEPLFTSEGIVVFDQFNNGDPYEDEDYIQRFRFLMKAIREKQPIAFKYTTQKKKTLHVRYCLPQYLEYSAKNDKFRLKTSGSRLVTEVNLSDIRDLSHSTEEPPSRKSQEQKNAEKRAVYQTLAKVLEANETRTQKAAVSFEYFGKKTSGTALEDENYTGSSKDWIKLERCVPLCFLNADTVKVCCVNGEIKTVRCSSIDYGSLEIHAKGRGVSEWKAIPTQEPKAVSLKVKNERDALERFKQTFSYCVREHEKNEGDWQYIRLYYDESEEKELVTNILSFGPYIEVLEPENFRGQIIKKLISQRERRIDTEKTDKKGDKHGKEETVDS